jgi:hypothetical protein
MPTKQRKRFNFFLSYFNAFELLEGDNEQQLIFIKYILNAQFHDKDLDDFPTLPNATEMENKLFRMSLELIKPILQQSKDGYKDKTSSISASKMDKEIQEGMADGTIGDKLIDAFTVSYLASNAILWDTLYKAFIENGNDADCEANYELYLTDFRLAMHARSAGWKKSIEGINSIFQRYIREKWIDLNKLDLK